MPPGGRGGTEARVEEGWQAGSYAAVAGGQGRGYKRLIYFQAALKLGWTLRTGKTVLLLGRLNKVAGNIKNTLSPPPPSASLSLSLIANWWW